MKIHQIFKLDIKKKQVISFVGGGGKTTTIFQLARELSKENKKMLISTTTKVFNPNKEEYDYYFLKDIDIDFLPLEGSITILGEFVKDKKLIGVTPEKIDEILDRNIFDFILIEADGSNRKSIKAPGAYEPIIPSKTELTVGVIGLDCFNKPINENTVHRPELLKMISGNEHLDRIDEDLIVNLVLDKNGIFKDSRGEKLLLLNKADDSKIINSGKNIVKKLKTEKFTKVILGDIKKKNFY